jgi:hypothetical protein
MSTASPKAQREQSRLDSESQAFEARLVRGTKVRLPSARPLYACLGVMLLLVVVLAFGGYRYAHAIAKIGQLERQLAIAPPDQRPRILGELHRTVMSAGVPGLSVVGPKGQPGTAGTPGAASTVPGPKGDTGTASTVPGPKGEKGDKGDTVIVPSPFPVPGPTVTITPPLPEPTPTPTPSPVTPTAMSPVQPTPSPTPTPAVQIPCLIICPPSP